ncbi:hypothetical protein SARC_04523 [Sphaeroforma arctica JP610]|uniref:PNPLA domain-containing protein n=1 Tax=Sphaeroforma arctica JP610 TaxID=667725 RepID=A0A0L0G2Z3_9EUKA|nr:hypothetical protein SARC_04523 [Sphaeroforma arctica JP610]KNC83191.1 hypothetical protein SARC_04523 [Sphaeroforma arctica JP610]|eukprot:XP_014157093.1 hypothetical protein SARC_04523 [Sphaeroforma arctica JP610]
MSIFVSLFTPIKYLTQVHGKPELSFSFAACGWLKMYHFGVAMALQRYELDKKAKFVGSSAGALTAAAILVDVDFISLKEYTLGCIRDVREPVLNMNAFRLRKYIVDIVDQKLGPKEFKHYQQQLEERMEVAVTALPGCHGFRYSKYTDYDHFKDVLLASCTAPPIAGFPFVLDGTLVADGGLADFQPLLDENTITVSPFYFHRTDIKPSQFIPAWWACYPGTEDEFEQLFRLGYEDAVTWIEANGYERPQNYEAPYWLSDCKGVHLNGKVVDEYPDDMPLEHEQQQREMTDMMRDVETALEQGAPEQSQFILDQAKSAILHEKYRARHHTKHIKKYRRRSTISIPRPVGNMSQILNVVFMLFIFGIVKPLTYLFLYLELMAVTYYALLRLITHDILPFKRRSRRTAYEHFLSLFRSLMSIQLLARAIVGPTVDIDSEKLFSQSIVYRVMMFFL